MTGNAANTSRYSLAVFPFLKTTEPVTIANVKFRSTDDISELSEEQAKRVREITEMLFLQDDLRIQSASYAIVPYIDFDHLNSDIEYLSRVQAVVAYEYAAPHPIFGDSFLSTEHASLAIFSPGRVPLSLVRPEHHVHDLGSSSLVPDEWHYVEGYTGIYNFRHPFWVTKGSRLYGPVPHLTLNMSQDLSRLIYLTGGRPDLNLLITALSTPATTMTERIFTAIRWHNQANAQASDDATAIVDLAIAFETMFGLPRHESKTQGLQDGISLLLGRIPRLDSWVEQFYQARSQIVHTGNTTQFRFLIPNARKDKNDKSGGLYHSLLSYGRHVFRLCVATLLTGAQLAERAGLADKLTSNQERFDDIVAILSNKSESGIEKLRRVDAVIRTLEQYKFVQEDGLKVETLLNAARLAVAAMLSCERTTEPQLKACLERLSAQRKTKDPYHALDALDALRTLHEHMSKSNYDAQPDEIRGTVFLLIDATWHYLFRLYHWLKEARNTGKDTST